MRGPDVSLPVTTCRTKIVFLLNEQTNCITFFSGVGCGVALQKHSFFHFSFWRKPEFVLSVVFEYCLCWYHFQELLGDQIACLPRLESFADGSTVACIQLCTSGTQVFSDRPTCLRNDLFWEQRQEVAEGLRQNCP